MFEAHTLSLMRTAVAVLFLVSAIGKIAHFYQFQAVIRSFGVVPGRLVSPVALVVVGAELVVAAMLAVGGALLTPGFVLGFVLLSMFSAVLIWILRRRVVVRCGCFGAAQGPVSGYDVARNVIMMGACLVGLSLSASAPPPVPVGESVVILAMACVFVAVVVGLREIVTTLRYGLGPAVRTSKVDARGREGLLTRRQ